MWLRGVAVVVMSLCIIQIILGQSMEEQPESSSEEMQFSQDQVVWAKITGYPWWPALITAAPRSGCGPFRVDFFADNTHAFVSHSKLAKYQQLRNEVDLHKHMKKGLRRAIASADQAIRNRPDVVSSLPHSREVVEVIAPTQKQLLQLPSIKTTPLQEKEHQQASPAQQAISALDQQSEQQLSQHEQQQQLPVIPQYSLEKRQKYVDYLLKKYELDNITRREERSPQRISRGAKEHRGNRGRLGGRKEKKMKRISKMHQHRYHQGPSMIYLLSRRLHKFLKSKPELSAAQRRAIILSLSKQVETHHPRMENAVEEVTKLLKWLQITPANTIASYYDGWSSFQTEKEKASNMTNEE